MKSAPAIIDALNEVLTGELTGINQYFVHAKMCENWGYQRLWEKIRAESIDEMKHADELIERILFLEGVPNLQRLGKVNVGETVPEQFELDLAARAGRGRAAQQRHRALPQRGDNGTRELFEGSSSTEEDHVDWLETQLS